MRTMAACACTELVINISMATSGTRRMPNRTMEEKARSGVISVPLVRPKVTNVSSATMSGPDCMSADDTALTTRDLSWLWSSSRRTGLRAIRHLPLDSNGTRST